MSLAQSPLGRRDDLRAAFGGYLLALADDELVLGHRHSEWTGFAPDIESDVALSSVAQEEIGHARLFYERAGDLLGGTPDDLAYGRAPDGFRNAVLVERPNGDWGFTIVRMFLYDRADVVRLDALAGGPVEPLADLAKTLRREEKYHLLYGEQWLRRLAGASGSSKARVQEALDSAWVEAESLFDPVDGHEGLVAAGVIPTAPDAQRAMWSGQVDVILEAIGLRVPEGRRLPKGRPGGVDGHVRDLNGRAGRHTADLRILLEEMTSVWRTEPGAKW